MIFESMFSLILFILFTYKTSMFFFLVCVFMVMGLYLNIIYYKTFPFDAFVLHISSLFCCRCEQVDETETTLFCTRNAHQSNQPEQSAWQTVISIQFYLISYRNGLYIEAFCAKVARHYALGRREMKVHPR